MQERALLHPEQRLSGRFRCKETPNPNVWKFASAAREGLADFSDFSESLIRGAPHAFPSAPGTSCWTCPACATSSSARPPRWVSVCRSVGGSAAEGSSWLAVTRQQGADWKQCLDCELCQLGHSELPWLCAQVVGTGAGPPPCAARGGRKERRCSSLWQPTSRQESPESEGSEGAQSPENPASAPGRALLEEAKEGGKARMGPTLEIAVDSERQVLLNRIRPSVQDDGGDVELKAA